MFPRRGGNDSHLLLSDCPSRCTENSISMLRPSPPVVNVSTLHPHTGRCRHLQEPLDQARMAESAASRCPSLTSLQQKRARCPAQSRLQSMPDKRRSRAQCCTIVAASSVETHTASLVMFRHPQTLSYARKDVLLRHQCVTGVAGQTARRHLARPLSACLRMMTLRKNSLHALLSWYRLDTYV